MMIHKTLKKFHPKLDISESLRWKEGVTPAEFQQLLLRYESEEEKLIEQLTH
jgi:hypothetical protein